MSADNPKSPPEKEDTGFIPGDDGWTRWRNTFTLLMGRMSDKGKNQYRKARDDRFQEADCKRCEKYRDYLLAYSKQTLGLGISRKSVDSMT